MAEAEQDVRKAGVPEPGMPPGGPGHAMGKVMDNARVSTVFGEPITQGGVTVIPVARVQGKGGGGGGRGPAQGAAQGGAAQGGKTSGGQGGGFGLSARPAGVFVLKDGKVSWRPSVDINRIVLGGQVVAAIALLTLRAILAPRRG
jgi:uncharacterized spore protein YtfJ